MIVDVCVRIMVLKRIYRRISVITILTKKIIFAIENRGLLIKM